MKYNLSLLKNIGRLINASCVYVLFFCTVLMMFKQDIPAPYCMIGIPLVLIGYQVVQYYCYQPVLYIFLHGIFFLPALLIPFPYTEYQYLYIAMLIAECYHAIRVWKENVEKPYEDIPWFLFIIICIIYLYALAYEQYDFARMVYFTGLLLIFIHFLRFFITGQNKLLCKSAETTTLPVKKIWLTTTLIFAFFMISFFILGTALQYIQLDAFLSAIGQMLVKVIRFIIHAIIYIVAFFRALFSKESHREETEAAKENATAAFEELSEPSLLAQIIDGCIIIAVLFIFIYLLYLFIVHFIQIFSKRFTKDSDIVVSLSASKPRKETPRSGKIFLHKLKELLGGDNVTTIRRAYRFKIQSYQGLELQKSNTTNEIENKVLEQYNEDIHELTTIYQKARYGNEELTFEDVKKGGLL